MALSVASSGLRLVRESECSPKRFSSGRWRNRPITSAPRELLLRFAHGEQLDRNTVSISDFCVWNDLSRREQSVVGNA